MLVVEDSEANRLIVQAYLEGDGHEVIMAENGAEGVEQFTEGSFDVVLMDVQMPVMDGYAGGVHGLCGKAR